MAILGDRFIDFVGVSRSVRGGEPHLSEGEVRACDHRFRGAEVFEHLDDLPDVQPRANYPCPSSDIIAAKRDSRKPPRAGGLLGESLDNRALRAPGPARLC